MINKLQKIFESVTTKTNQQIKDKEQLNHLIYKLKERKIIIEHDIPLLEKFIIDFPLSIQHFCSYIRQIFLLNIEKQIDNKLNSIEEIYQRIFRFLHYFSFDALNSEDLQLILTKINCNIENLKESLQNFNKNEFLLKNIRFDTKHFLWEKIIEKIHFQNEIENPDFFVTDSSDYQHKMQHLIEYELEIIKTKRIQINPDKMKLLKKIKKVKIEKVFCSVRDIPIESWKVPTNFYDRDILNKIYSKCEALKELLFSKHFQNFLGFDDMSSEENYFYFFENLEGSELIPLIKNLELDISENSLLFRYIAHEILKGMRDLIYKSTYCFKFPINIEDIYYEASQLRLYLNIEFGQKKKTILQSQSIIEAKLLFFYGLILLRVLAVNKPELDKLVKHINVICADLNELEQMKSIYDLIPYIEESLPNNLESDVIISIIVECLVSPYKAKIIFDEFYEKKNFLKDALRKTERGGLVLKVKEEKVIGESVRDDVGTCDIEDQLIAYEPYYKKDIEDPNFILLNKMMTINLLLIHPYYSDIKLEESLLSILFKR